MELNSKIFKRLWSCISKKRKIQVILLLVLMIFSSIAEIASIGSVFPFLLAISDPSKLLQYKVVFEVANFFGINSTESILLPLGALFIVCAILACVTRLLLVWANTRLSFMIGADIGGRLFRESLYQPYAEHIKRNSSELINAISRKSDLITQDVILPTLTLLSSSIMLVIVIGVLLTIDFFATIEIFAFFGGLYALVIFKTRSKLLSNSGLIARESNTVIKILHEGVGGIRDILIDNTQEAFVKKYLDADYRLRTAQASSLFIAAGPRFIMEALGMILIALIACFYYINKTGEIGLVFAGLGGLALGAQRLLPIMQHGYFAWSNIKSAQASALDVLALLTQKSYVKNSSTRVTRLKFKDCISIKDICFKYEGATQNAIKNLSMTIKKGEIVGLIGKTGSGKSTFLDILLGLLTPTKGCIQIDSVVLDEQNITRWQKNIGHVPQFIYLAESTIRENIAFGVSPSEIDDQLVVWSARMAQLTDVIENIEGGYYAEVGERGVKLSGGQRQRIGLARALYKKAEVIVLDEATSALDNETEAQVMDTISKLEKSITVIMVSHRVSTLACCDRIYELKNGCCLMPKAYENL
jgi:ATP-binding cassette subfamily B protein